MRLLQFDSTYILYIYTQINNLFVYIYSGGLHHK